MASTKKDRIKYAISISGRANILFHNAKRRNECSLTREWIEEKLKKGICEYTGLPFVFETTKKYTINPYAPSLDRINPKLKEYSPSNTRVVLASVNTTLNQYDEKEILPILKAMIKSIESK